MRIDLKEKLNQKAQSAHDHAISEVTGLRAELDSKANVGAASGIASARLTQDRNTTSSTFSNVTDLAIAIGASETWSFEAALTCGCNNTGGSQYTVTVPSGATLRLMVQGNTTAATAWTGVSITTSGANTVTVCTANAQGRLVLLSGVVVNSTSAGNIQVQFRSITGTQTTTVNANSYITGRKH